MVDDARADRDALDYLRPRHVAVALALALAACAWVAPTLAEAPAALPSFLRLYIRASDSELRRLDRGDAITRTLQSPDSREITTLGAIRVACRADTFFSRVRDVERFKASEYVLQIGRFAATPSPADVAALELDEEDRRDLRVCRPGKCALRLPAADITAMRDHVPWGTAQESAVAGEAMRAFIARQARDYVAGGSAALGDYADQSTPMPRAAAFHGLLRVSAFKGEYQPQIFDFLGRFPTGDATGIESVLLWSREKFGLKPVTNITHSAIWRRDEIVVFASKQVYTTHYFDASLGMSVFVPSPGTNHGYVTYMNRTRIEGLRGVLGGMVRAIATRRGRDGLERTLLDVRKKLEAEDKQDE